MAKVERFPGDKIGKDVLGIVCVMCEQFPCIHPDECMREFEQMREDVKDIKKQIPGFSTASEEDWAELKEQVGIIE